MSILLPSNGRRSPTLSRRVSLSSDQRGALNDLHASQQQEKQLFPFFDMAYQGFASGNTTRDAFAVRYFVEQGHQVVLAQSFAKVINLIEELSRSRPHAVEIISEHGSLRRACWCFLHRYQLSRRKGSCRQPAEDRHPPHVFKPSNSRCSRRRNHLERRPALHTMVRSSTVSGELCGSKSLTGRAKSRAWPTESLACVTLFITSSPTITRLPENGATSSLRSACSGTSLQGSQIPLPTDRRWLLALPA